MLKDDGGQASLPKEMGVVDVKTGRSSLVRRAVTGVIFAANVATGEDGGKEGGEEGPMVTWVGVCSIVCCNACVSGEAGIDAEAFE